MNQKIDIKNIPSDVKVHRPEQSDNHTYNLRSRIYVRAVKGLHQLIRRKIGIISLGLFGLLPWLKYGDRQAILLDIVNQEFNIFGLTLWPQDLTLFASILIISAYLLFFVTTFYGRVWCGYLCPQTVWTFMFIWFEEKIEGTANKRKRFDEMPMSWTKVWKKTLKHTSWWGVSLLTSLTFIGYFVPIDQLFVDFFTFEASSAIVGWTLFFAGATYANAGWMREVMCIHMCPYSRFQSSMFDKDTFTVTYDTERGEKRGPRSRKVNREENGLGDCIDCNLCVQVCPTGIDIRNGLQYECINCGACIDACDETMDKMNYPRGLISYTTEHSLEGKPTKILRGKLYGYLVVISIMFAAFIWQISSRVPLELNIERDRNALYRETDEGLIENTYTLQIINKSQTDNEYLIEIQGLDHFDFIGLKQIKVKAGEVLRLPISIAVDPFELNKPITDIKIVLHSTSGDLTVDEESRFFKGR
ncbi:cytochrome c oxidase accessory protein CcoG [Psychrosphaera sp. B3R10]|uniref:cytochrome c oxidase accessory protein CcoG n=1 Tax=unclassified Psychrosphaera TaxID=2641570 RepID=UPI001C084EC6|nr:MULTISPECIES: cytochrome c oxidase accessory protein CcoG [unclassified Psychrosphaera]MBU2883404.1 cytochrome c oxidase accessory protein CcoG [Psychrosphaera sp. I2R16]MBU2990502.1 cytochrome c oxidase accessory protein CcoG [Psychrosphaera sp. B3R10]MDO6719024.1 cytochrome c oxidase accessory protein CcoG [Psychrosphaera sp. 1_MG-2023]